MKVIFRFQDVLEIMNDCFLALEANATEAQKTTHHELSNKEEKYLFLIHQCVDSNIFEKIIKLETTKEA